MVSKKDETRLCGDTNRVSVPTNHRRIDDMNSVQNKDLTFQQTAFHPVSHKGEIWLTSSELAAALGYKKSDAVTQIFSRYHDEFTDNMSTTLKMRVVRKTGVVDIPVRVFSLRGAHLIAMFSSTQKAKEFRRWVLDILDREVAKGTVPVKFDFEMYAQNANAACAMLDQVWDIFHDELEPALRSLASPVATKIVGRIIEAKSISYSIRGGLLRAAGNKNGSIH
ncbi:BRO family protein [Enterobacter roggenkampii]|uniref:BRO-N domain-containing protein n=1 Tax=Enterobacter cloacae complex TaxID=354276 RepID=UPI0037542458